MSSSRGTTAVRMALLTFVLAALATSLLAPAQAGTQEAPEIADPAGDQDIDGNPLPASLGTVPGLSDASDLRFGWVTENLTDLQLNLQTEGDIAAVAVPMVPVDFVSFGFEFHFTIGATESIASVTIGGAGATAGGVATAAVLNGTMVTLTVPKATVGALVPGTTLTGLFAQSSGTILSDPLSSTLDRAPNEGSGQDYVITGGGSVTPPPTNPNDTDADGLNDTCEQTYFGNLTATDNASADPDNDTLTNGQECSLGTDPTKADTDGDGVRDDQDSAPTDPSKGGNTTNTTTSTSSTTTTSSSTTTSRSTTTSSSSTTSKDDSIKSLDDAIEALKSDLGYLGGSAGGLLAVLVLCILALAVRWSL